MTHREWIDQYADETGEPLLVMDGFDDCIAGIVQRFNDTFVVYDKHKVLARLIGDGMSEEEAAEFWAFNQVGAWMGEGTPGFLTIIEPEKSSEEEVYEH
jgi:hypothetical protein